jgi:long-chain acyl-CoA synthetase
LEVVVKGLIDENGDERSLMAEVFLSEDKTSEEVFKDIKRLTRALPVYKQITKVVVREEEFPKTTSRKIKR